MRKYRIIKKINFTYGSTFYKEAYIIEVKRFLFYSFLNWWCGSDLSDTDFWFKDLELNGNTKPQPFKETTKKFGNVLRYCSGTPIITNNYNAAKYFLQKVIELDEYMKNQKLEINKKENKEKTFIIKEEHISYL